MALFGAISSASSMSSTIPVKQYATPATAGTVTVAANGNTVLFLNPAGTIATLTVNLPSTPSDLDRVTLGTSQIVTSLTLGNGTIIGAITTLALGAFATYIYSSDTSSWFRMG